MRARNENNPHNLPGGTGQQRVKRVVTGERECPERRSGPIDPGMIAGEVLKCDEIASTGVVGATGAAGTTRPTAGCAMSEHSPEVTDDHRCCESNYENSDGCLPVHVHTSMRGPTARIVNASLGEEVVSSSREAPLHLRSVPLERTRPFQRLHSNMTFR